MIGRYNFHKSNFSVFPEKANFPKKPMNIMLSLKEVTFLVALLEADRQTALQLLAAEHFYKPELLPKLHKLERGLKKVEVV